jgi:predicted permease
MLANLLQDVRYALHGFARKPMFAVVVVLTLAVGIGVNVAVFSLFDQIMLRELDVSRPAELVNLVGGGVALNQITNNQGGDEETFSYPMFRDLEAAGEPYVALGASRIIRTALGYGDRTEPGAVVLVSGGYFAALGVGPELGRVLGRQDVVDAQAVMLSYEHWTTAYGADPAVLGQTLVVAGQPLEIVGVAPRGFVGTTPGERPAAFAPLTLSWMQSRSQPLVEDRLFSYLYVFGRLKPAVSLEQAQAALAATYRAIVTDVEAPLMAGVLDGRYGEILEDFRAQTLSLVSGARGQTRAPELGRTPLAIFFATTATILLIACVNLANLMFARAAARVGEIAVRASLGAARRRLLGMLSVEALLLAGFAALLSLPIALGVLRGVDALQPPGLGVHEVGLDPRTAGAALVIAALSAVVFALAPIVKLVATDPTRALQSNGARSFGGKPLGRFRFTLATTQIALSMLLLVLAALFAQSLVNVARVDLGLQTESVVTFRLIPGLNGYPPERQLQVFEDVERELAAQPGVMSVSSASVALLAHSQWSTNVDVEGLDSAEPRETIVNANRIGTGFFATLDIPLLAGRDFTDADRLGRPKVAIVNESFVKRFGLPDNPVGRRIGFDPPDGPLDTEIVGLVRDSAYDAVKNDFPAQLLLPRAQAERFDDGVMFYVRTTQTPEALLAALPRLVGAVDPNLPVIEPSTFDSVVRRNVQTDWLLVSIAGVLAGVATLLAAVGLYGVLSYMVAQRTREIGLRLALGAEPAGVRQMVMKQVGWMAGLGVPIGIAAALPIGNLAASVLFGLAPTDPAAILAAAVVLAGAVLGASYWPARRASRVDPVVALRTE